MKPLRIRSLALMVTLLPAATLGGELSLSASGSTLISDTSGNGCYLVDIRGITQLEGVWVSGAGLTLEFSGGTSGEEVDVAADLVLADWSAGASWASPWVTPGGDRIGLADAGVVSPSAGAPSTIRLDATDWVRAIVEDGAGDYGLIVFPNGLGTGFTPSQIAALGTVTSATLDIRYRSLTAMGYSQGAKALRVRKQQTREATDRPGR